MKYYEEDPLPGLDFDVQPRQSVARGRRPYSNRLEPTPATIERFWSKVVRTPSCWIWTGAISGGDGYGRITWRSQGVSRTMSTHRFALFLTYGDGKPHSVGEHRCNEPLCVRVDPEHVIPSDQTSNLRYAVSLGRAGAYRIADDRRTRSERSLAVRDALKNGWDPIAYARAAGETGPAFTPRLF